MAATASSSYKLAEAEFNSPRLFDRRGELTVLGGWRDATQVAFHGLGMNTSSGDRANYGFEQPFGSALLTIRPTRRLFMVRGGFEASRWDLKSGTGTAPSVDEVYTPESLPGLGTTTTYLHSQATVGFDSRPAGGYARRGGFYGVTGHDYTDSDDAFGFRQVDYEAIQHIPDPARELGRSRCTASRRRHATRATSRFRSSCCRRSAADQPARVRQLSLPRPPQPAAAGGVADHGQPLLR